MKAGTFNPTGKKYIKLEAADPQALMPAAAKTGLNWQITASPKAPKSEVGLTIRLKQDPDIQPQGYKLSIRPDHIEITASDPAGAFYGACTLAQILEQSESQNLNCLSIADWPDFPIRGVMLDISRDKIPTMETIYHLVDLLASWKINQLQLYTEAAFAYLAHPVVWEHASPMTGEQMMALDAYCKCRFIDLVPNQNSFGHLERWFKHKEYNSMAEAPKGCDTIWGFREAYSLCPMDKRSLPFVEGLFEELLPHFTSDLFNVGCDETVDLGRGRSKKACQERGTGRVYLDFLLSIYRLVEERNKTMMYWGDIIVEYPNLVPSLPKNAIALEWGYDYDHPFDAHGKIFADSGIPFYVCPGTSTWNTLSGRTDNCVKNIENAAKNGSKHGAIGFLNTDWGDNGHWQPLSTAYLGLLAGAMASWNVNANFEKSLTETLSILAFKDSTRKMGKAFYDLGNIYRIFSKRTHTPWQILSSEPGNKTVLKDLTTGKLDDMDKKVNEIEAALRGETASSPDADIVRQEIAHIINMLRLAGKVGRLRIAGKPFDSIRPEAKDIKKRQEQIWLLRNRPGGLSDSLKKMRALE